MKTKIKSLTLIASVIILMMNFSCERKNAGSSKEPELSPELKAYNAIEARIPEKRRITIEDGQKFVTLYAKKHKGEINAVFYSLKDLQEFVKYCTTQVKYKEGIPDDQKGIVFYFGTYPEGVKGVEPQSIGENTLLMFPYEDTDENLDLVPQNVPSNDGGVRTMSIFAPPADGSDGMQHPPSRRSTQ